MKIFNHHAILIEDNHKGIDYKIVLIDSGWFTCYLDISNTKLKFIDYNSIELHVWWGLTYSDFKYPWEREKDENKWIIGWDYGHYNDALEVALVKTVFDKTVTDKFLGTINHTLPELTNDCIEAIDELLDRPTEELIYEIS